MTVRKTRGHCIGFSCVREETRHHVGASSSYVEAAIKDVAGVLTYEGFFYVLALSELRHLVSDTLWEDTYT